MKKYYILKIFMIIFFICSCSSLSKKDCNELNWFDRGRTDVIGGKLWKSKISDYRESCNKHGVSIDESSYLKGVVYAGEIKCTGYKSFHDGRWLSVGKGDALLGRSSSYIKKHTLSCNLYNVSPDTHSYLKGYKIGLKQFCTYENGFSFGKSGEDYINTCSGQLDVNFKKGYRIGKAVYLADMSRFEVEKKQKEKDQLFDEIVELSDSIKEQEYKLKNFDRDELRDIEDVEKRIRDKSREIRFAELDKKPAGTIKMLELQLAKLEDELVSTKRKIENKKRSLESTIRSEESKLRTLELRYRSFKRKILLLEEKAKKAELHAERLQSN